MDTWISAAVCWKIFTWIWRCSTYNKTKKIGGAPISVRPIKHSKYRRRNNWIHMDSHVYLQCIIILCYKVLLSALPFSCIIHIFEQWMHFIPGWAPTFLMSAILANSRTQDSRAISLSLYSRPQKRQPLCLRLNMCISRATANSNPPCVRAQKDCVLLVNVGGEWATYRTPAACGAVPQPDIFIKSLKSPSLILHLVNWK